MALPVSSGATKCARVSDFRNFLMYLTPKFVSADGYAIEHDGLCTTVFSAPNYVDQVGNKGAFVCLRHVGQDFESHILLDTNRCTRGATACPIRSHTSSANETDGIRTRRSSELDDVDLHVESRSIYLELFWIRGACESYYL